MAVILPIPWLSLFPLTKESILLHAFAMTSEGERRSANAAGKFSKVANVLLSWLTLLHSIDLYGTNRTL